MDLILQVPSEYTKAYEQARMSLIYAGIGNPTNYQIRMYMITGEIMEDNR